MNWRRGLFRLWVAASAAWIIFLVGLMVVDPPANPRWDRVAIAAVILPAAVWALGMLTVWIGRGFRKSA
jgi:hypothetical protein